MSVQIMGILNVTPDSFADGGKFLDTAAAVAHAKQMVADGADIIDVGGESSRPGSERVSVEEELDRILPVIRALLTELDVPLSIDSHKPGVVEKCLDLGVKMVNDITGLREKLMREIVARHDVPAIIMHMQGEPKSMQENPTYSDVVDDIKKFFIERITLAKEAGITELILDPGIGFGKTLEHNSTIFKRLGEFSELNYPILIGASRKSFIDMVSNLDVEDRVPGSLAAAAISVFNGATFIRTHDVLETKRAVEVAEAIAHG